MLDNETTRHYREFRKNGFGAKDALIIAKSINRKLEFDWKQRARGNLGVERGHKKIDGFDVYLNVSYDDTFDYKDAGLGRFEQRDTFGKDEAIVRWPDTDYERGLSMRKKIKAAQHGRYGALKRDRRARHGDRWQRVFVPEYSLAERRESFHARGHSRGVADYLARQDIKKDMKTLLDDSGMTAYDVTVEVYKKGVKLGSACMGMGRIEYPFKVGAIAEETVHDYDTLDEAMKNARETLESLCAKD